MIAHLPELLRSKAMALSRPVFRMKRCLYGHPVSGGLYIRASTNALKAAGYQQSVYDAALFYKQDSVVAVYSDDNSIAGPVAQMDAFETTLRPTFHVDEFGVGDRILGMQPHRHHDSERGVRSLCVDMTAYAESIVDRFEKGVGSVVRPCGVMGTCDLRDASADDSERLIKEGKVAGRLLPMLLWLCRCARFDIAAPTALLCARIGSWSTNCQFQLSKLVGYVKSTKHLGLRMNLFDIDVANKQLFVKIYSDADLAVPRSQSGHLLGVAGSAGSWVPTAWSSKSQSICADSTAVAETIACTSAIKSHLQLALEIDEFLLRQGNRPVPVLVDNAALIRIGSHGASTPLAVLARAVALRLGLLRGIQAAKFVKLQYVNTAENRSNLLTKVLTSRVACERERLLAGIGVTTAAPTPMVFSTRFCHDVWVVESAFVARIHRTPRRRLFSPHTCLPDDIVVDDLGDTRVTCYAPLGGHPDRDISSIESGWKRDPRSTRRLKSQWLGVSVFSRV